MNSIFKLLDPNCNQDDAIQDRMQQEKEVVKQLNFLGFSLICVLISISIMLFCIYKSSRIPPRPTFAVKAEKGVITKDNQIQSIITLPVPHQSLNNVSGWLMSALNTIYGVGFDNIEEKMSDAEYYFTGNGYTSYVKAMNGGFKEDIIKKKLKITLLAAQNPVLINSGVAGDIEFWRLRVPVLISYLGGKEIVTSQKMVEALIIRVPAYQNEKGLAISEFIMGGN